MNINEFPAVQPLDEHNQALVANVHPTDWVNPEPAEMYNLVVIGAGTAGLVTAAGAAGVGAKVALIERHLMGGDCLNVGCVPSKMLISAGRNRAEMERAGEFGNTVENVGTDFPKVMERMRKLRAGISKVDGANRFKELGIDVFMGEAKFGENNTVEVDGKKLRYKKAVIATGARAVELPIPGLMESGAMTNETVFSLTELPRRLAVIGGGPIGSELAQTFRHFGSEVTMIDKSDHILAREDADAAKIVQEQFKKDGVKLLLNAETEKVEGTPDGVKTVHYKINELSGTLEVDAILVGVGRQPNTEGLNLEGVGVKYDRSGVEVDDCLRTANPDIYAAGDICMKWKFTHAADFAARYVIQNALFFGKKKLSSLTMPWATYTSPEVAHVGLYGHEAKDQGIEIDTYTQSMEHVDRAIAEGETEGFVKIHTKKGSGEILGATIVAGNAGDLISEISTAMAAGMSLGSLANVIHPYPTQAEAIRKCGDQYNKGRFTPRIKSLMTKFLAWRR